MTYEYARAFVLILATVLIGIAVSNAVAPVKDPYVVVRARVVDTGDEIAKRKDAVYDRRMAQ
jgi:hypothetical protein